MTGDPAENVDWSGLAILDLEECYRLLAREPIGRLGFVEGGEPVILPVNFTVDGRCVIFRTARGSKLDAAIMQKPVCFEVDGWDVPEHEGWSVLVKGTAEEVIDADETNHLDSLPVQPWSRPDLRTGWVRILPMEVSGRRISKAAVAQHPG